jgi:hypothetical protein
MFTCTNVDMLKQEASSCTSSWYETMFSCQVRDFNHIYSLFIYVLFIVVSALFVPESSCPVAGEAYCCGVTEAHFFQIMLLCLCCSVGTNCFYWLWGVMLSGTESEYGCPVNHLTHWNTQPAVRRPIHRCFAVNSSILSVDGMTSYTVWKLKNRSIEWYITHTDCIDF